MVGIAHIIDRKGFYIKSVEVIDGVKPLNSRIEPIPESWSGGIRWEGDHWGEYDSSPVYAPTPVESYKIKLVLAGRGILSNVEALINSLSGVELQRVKIFYDKDMWSIDNVLLQTMAAGIGLTKEDIEEIFVEANNLNE